MKLKSLATKPQLVRVALDDEDTIKEHGEELEFWVWDKQPLAKFIRFANVSADSESFPELVEFCSQLILDESGEPVIGEGEVLPAAIMVRCINKVVEQLGK
jgi:hypothetical protein